MTWRVRRAAPADAAALSLVASASFLVGSTPYRDAVYVRPI